MKILNYLRLIFETWLLKNSNVEIFFCSELQYPIEPDAGAFLVRFTETRLRKVNYVRTLRISKTFPVTHFESITEALQRVRFSKRKFVMLVTPGQFFENSFFVELLKTLRKWPSQVFLMGHLLDHSQREEYLDLHPMCMVISVENFNKAFSNTHSLSEVMTQKETSKKKFHSFQRSPNNIHDDYTPLWIRPQNSEKLVAHNRYFSTFIDSILNSNYELINFPPALRALKYYCYYRFSETDLKKVEKGFSQFGPEAFHKKNRVTEMFQKYLKDQAQFGKKIYVQNDEPIFLPEVEKPFDCFIGLASGLKLFGQYALLPREGTQTQIWVVDSRDSQIEFFKQLLQLRRIEEYPQWLSDHGLLSPLLEGSKTAWLRVQRNKPGYPGSSRSVVLSDLQEHWESFKKCEFVFKKLDLLTEFDPLRASLMGRRQVHLWLSNIYGYQWTMFRVGYPQLCKDFTEALKQLRSLETPVYLDIYYPHGDHFSGWNSDIPTQLRTRVWTLDKQYANIEEK